jgi:hypothetical protein
MDGPNVNWKFVDMFSCQLIDEGNGTFLNIGSCGLHIIHGAFKQGSNSTSWELERFFFRLHQSNWLFKIRLKILQASVVRKCSYS